MPFCRAALPGKGLAAPIVREAMKWGRERGPTNDAPRDRSGEGVYEKLGWEPTTEMRYTITMVGN
jgi:hypothetical protein